MPGVSRCQLRTDTPTVARSAVGWLRAFYPEISVVLEPDCVVLCAESRTNGELATIWKSTLANEYLLERGAARRAAMLTELLA